MSAKPSFFIIDTNHLIYRAHFAFIRTPIKNKLGKNVSALFGFSRMILKFFREFQPSHIAFTMDRSRATFRKSLYPQYKENRQATPDEIREQTPRVRELIETLGCRILDHETYEADDLIGTLAEKLRLSGWEAHIVSGDRDLLQLLDPGVTLHLLTKGITDIEVFDGGRYQKESGLLPSQIPELKGLMGDDSDNIPGVRGIGEKTAIPLIQKYGRLENLFAHLPEIKGKLGEKLQTDRESAFLSRTLGTIVREVPIDFHPDDYRLKAPLSRPELISFFTAEGFPSLVEFLRPPDSTSSEKIPAPAPPPTHRAILINTSEGLLDLSRKLAAAPRFAIDLETTGLDPHSATIVGIAIALDTTTGYYIPVGHLPAVEAPDQLPRREVLVALAPLLGDGNKLKICHNIKFELRMFAAAGAPLKPPHYDTMIAAWLLDPTRPVGLKILAEDWLGEKMVPITDLIGNGKGHITFDAVPLERALPYATHDAVATLKLYDHCQQHLPPELHSHLQEVELPLLDLLARMETRGIRIDSERLDALSVELQREADDLSKKIQALFGTEFNLNSPKQLGAILFDQLKIQENLPFKIKKNKTGYSTDSSVLQKLQFYHPGVASILEYREVTKLRNTYTDTLPKLVHPTTGRLHTHFQPTGTATGRLSSTEPNLQNIPIKSRFGPRIRAAFRASSNDSILLGADYSQIELRVFAHLSGDPTLIAAFHHGEDIHSATARAILGTGERVSPEERRRAKAINFGILYGMGPFGLAEQLGIPRSLARELIDNYFQNFGRVRAYIDATIAHAREMGYATTLLGRRRPIPEILSRNQNERQNGERIAVNTSVQGSAADLIKLAMLKIDAEMGHRTLNGHLLLQVHDELIFETPRSEAETLAGVVRDCMVGCYPLAVPLEVTLGIGETWGDLK